MTELNKPGLRHAASSCATRAVDCADAYGNVLRNSVDSIAAETLASVSDTYNMFCGTDTIWLSELHEALPDLYPSEARFITLVLIANKAHAISERALDLLVEQRRTHPELQALIDDLMADNGGNALCGRA